ILHAPYVNTTRRFRRSLARPEFPDKQAASPMPHAEYSTSASRRHSATERRLATLASRILRRPLSLFIACWRCCHRQAKGLLEAPRLDLELFRYALSLRVFH